MRHRLETVVVRVHEAAGALRDCGPRGIEIVVQDRKATRAQRVVREPQGVTGRRFQTTSKPTNFVYNLQRVAGSSTNDFKFGYNAAQTTEVGVAGIEGTQALRHDLDRLADGDRCDG